MRDELDAVSEFSKKASQEISLLTQSHCRVMNVLEQINVQMSEHSSLKDGLLDQVKVLREIVDVIMKKLQTVTDPGIS